MSELGRDCGQGFPVTMTWAEWIRLWSLVYWGMNAKRADDCPDEESARDREICQKFTLHVGEGSPGNGMEYWPAPIKEVYDEAVAETWEEITHD